MTKIGFTGTRLGLTELQSFALRQILEDVGLFEFGHGDCVGADEQAARIAYELGAKLTCFPPVSPDKRAFTLFNHETMMAETYFARNRSIAQWCDMLIGCPPSDSRLTTGGTWYTIDYSLKIKKPTSVIWPNGTVLELK